MKKFIVIMLITFMAISSIFAAVTVNTYAQPMIGTGGIPMNPSRTKQFSPYTKINSVVSNDWDSFTGDAPFMENVVIQSAGFLRPAKTKPADAVAGRYSSQEIICIGGAKDISNTFSTVRLVVEVECDGGFFFVSQSNPFYRRPFEFSLIPKIGKTKGKNMTEFYGKTRELKQGQRVAEFSYTKTENDNFDTFDIWFDLVLTLPGTITTGDMVDNIYPLVVTDDYSAKVKVTVSAFVDGATAATSVSSVYIPFTGFYESVASGSRDSTVALHIKPTALAGSLNLETYSTPQEIADIEILGVKQLGAADDWPDLGIGFIDDIIDKIFGAAPKYFIGIFLSSSENPMVQGDHFMLVRDNLKGDIKSQLNPYNHILFDVKLTNKANLAEIKTYTGTDYLKKTPTLNNFTNSIFNFLIVPEGTQNRATNSKLNNNMSYVYSATASVILEEKTGVLMEEGRYIGDIYVHVVTLE